MKKVILPNNGFGLCLMLIAIALIGIVPFVVVLWLTLKLVPWWVAVPVASAVSFFTLLLTVKRNKT